ncbi:sulfotransferase domain-containing protein [Arenicella xantha]|uniref:Sulfotransferase domain-containing protein n=1 Tax=Arenicella xantha TaxID=644221 RepID=A0A395JJ99_9GAMM|nr:sulfotransferase domain-containing protein [Arenicella xantha]RBP49933.1 sulfotransferase domain-containing protein [Arenicella xantha]
MSSGNVKNGSHDFFWLASYPKSGNTWFRIFLTSLFNGENTPLDINSLGHGQVPNLRRILDELNGFDSVDLSFDELNCIRTEGLRWLSQTNQSNVYYKTHAAYTYNQNNRPVLGGRCDGIAGALYFIRNPLDVCISYAHHAGVSVDKSIEVLANGELKSQSLHGNIHIPEDVLCWSQNVKSWLSTEDLAVTVIRYEDMLVEPMTTFSKACEFLNIDTDSKQIQRALVSCSFENLQKQEQVSAFVEKPARSPNFFRKGIAGDWQNTLNTEQIDKIVDRHGSMMKQFGYLTEHGVPKVS